MLADLSCTDTNRSKAQRLEPAACRASQFSEKTCHKPMDVGAVVAEAMEGIDGRASVSSGTLPDGQSALQPAEPSGSGASPSSVDPGEMQERLKSRSIDELKSLLRAKKMKLSGTKTDLIARLVSNAIGVDEGGSAKGASRLNQAQLNMIKVRWPFQWLCCSLCTTNSSRSAPTVIG